jgi:hypothetical protein
MIVSDAEKGGNNCIKMEMFMRMIGKSNTW